MGGGASAFSSHRDELLTWAGPGGDTTLALLGRRRPQRAPTPNDWRHAAVPEAVVTSSSFLKGVSMGHTPQGTHLGVKEHKFAFAQIVIYKAFPSTLLEIQVS